MPTTGAPAPPPPVPPGVPSALRLPVPVTLAYRASALADDHPGLSAALGRWARRAHDADAGFDLWMAFAQQAPGEVEAFLAGFPEAWRMRLPAQLVQAAGRARGGPIDAARARWDVLVDAARASGDKRLLAHALAEAGRAHGLALDPRRALPCFVEAIPLAQAIGDPRLETRLCADEAAVLGLAGDAVAEREGTARALALAVEAGDVEAEAHCRVNLALGLARSGDRAAARAACRASREAARLLGLPYVEALGLHGEALVAAREGAGDAAAGLQAAALGRLQLMGKRATAARQQLDLAVALAAGAQPAAAAAWADRAVAAARAVGVRGLEAKAWAARAAAAEELGDAPGALRAWRRCAELQREDLEAERPAARQEAARGRAFVQAVERAREQAAARAAAEAEAAGLRACVEALRGAAEELLRPVDGDAALPDGRAARARLSCLVHLSAERGQGCALVLMHLEGLAAADAERALVGALRTPGLGLVGPGRWADGALWALLPDADLARAAGIGRALRLRLGPAGEGLRVAAVVLPAVAAARASLPEEVDAAAQAAERALRLARGAGRDRVEAVVGAEG